MNDHFTDAGGARLAFVPLGLDEGETSSVYVALVPAYSGRVLTASPDAGLTVEARRTGSGEPFANIAAAPVDLTPFAGANVSFDFRVTAGEVAADSPLQARVRVAYA